MTYSVTVMATGYQFISEFEMQIETCLAAETGNGSQCITNAIEARLGEEKPVFTTPQLKKQLDEWLREGHVISIMSMSTKELVRGLIIDKTYRILSSNNAMAVLQLNSYSVDNIFYIRSFDIIVQDEQVVSTVCNDACH